MILKDIQNLGQQKTSDKTEQEIPSFSKVKLFFQFLLFLPKLLIAIPVILFHIVKGILYIRKNIDIFEEEVERLETNLDASYEDVIIDEIEADYDKGFVHFRLNRDAVILWVHDLKKQLELEENPDEQFTKTNWHLHSDFISPALPLEITFYPDTGKITIDRDYNLFGSPYYFKKLIQEFDTVIDKSENAFIVLDACDTEIIDKTSDGRIIFEIQF